MANLPFFFLYETPLQPLHPPLKYQGHIDPNQLVFGFNCSAIYKQWAYCHENICYCGIYYLLLEVLRMIRKFFPQLVKLCVKSCAGTFLDSHSHSRDYETSNEGCARYIICTAENRQKLGVTEW